MSPERLALAESEAAADAAFDRLLAVEAELLWDMGARRSGEPARNTFAIVRGHMELYQRDLAPLNIDAVESGLVAIAESIVGDRRRAFAYIAHIRADAEWVRRRGVPQALVQVTVAA